MNKNGFKEVDPKKYSFPEIGVGLIGYGFMGKAHTNAFKKISFLQWPPVAIPKLVAVCGHPGSEERAEEAAFRFGYNGFYNDFRLMVKDPDIDLIDNCTPDNMHCEPSIVAVQSGKHIICEKPLAMTVEDAWKMYEAAKKAKVKHMLAHNYRFLPAVMLAREIISKGMIGKVYEFRGRYLQSVGAYPQNPIEDVWYASGTGSGINLGIGSHIIDMARFLVSEIKTVSGIQKTFNTVRKNKNNDSIDVLADETNFNVVEFDNGAIGSIESSGLSSGRLNHHTWEVNGSEGSMYWDLEDLNHLNVWLKDSPVKQLNGFMKVSATDPGHPFAPLLWPPGHNLGWENGHVNELAHLLDCIVNDKDVDPFGATFYDGYVIQLIMEKMKEASDSGKKIEINPGKK